MITIKDEDLPITVAQKLITGTKEEVHGLDLHPDMYSQEEIKEIAFYLHMTSAIRMATD